MFLLKQVYVVNVIKSNKRGTIGKFFAIYHMATLSWTPNRVAGLQTTKLNILGDRRGVSLDNYLIIFK